MKLITGYQDTRTNNEDFALTPFLFLVYSKKQVYGIGVCCGYYAFFVGVGNVPKGYGRFVNLSNKER